jgi:NADH dehydrogenase FAD-containing subunit
MNKQPTQIIVIGAGYAGLLAAVRLYGKTRRQNVSITLVNAADHFIERMRLHQFAANQDIPQRPIADILRGTRINFVAGFVSEIDTPRREIVVKTSAGEQRMHYDNLVYALGSTIDRNSVPGVREYAYTLTPNGEMSAFALRDALLNTPSGKIVICGGGATGIEAAAEFAEAYPNAQVRLVTRGEFGMFLGKGVAKYMRNSLTRLGVTIQDRTTIAELQSNHILTTSGESISYDVCLWTGGFTVPSLARESGLTVNETGQILIDPFMRSISHPEIYAIGDAAHPREKPGVRMRMSAFTAAVSAAHGADCLAAHIKGQMPKPFSFAYMGQGIALGRHNAIGFNNYPADKPNMPYFTGWLGVQIREFFVRFLASGAIYERRIPGFFMWIGKNRYSSQHKSQRRTQVSKTT